MKHQIRDFIILLISFFGISFLYRTYLKRKGPLVRVLCFHDVADQSWFKSVIELLIKDYLVITPEQFYTRDFSQNKINILLTFDDGYQSWIDNCLPVLSAFNLKGLFFINSGLLDIALDPVKVASYMKERLFISPKSALTWEGAKQLVVKGHSIGGHTVSHPNLALLATAEVQKEVQEDKKRLEGQLSAQLVDFAYPFGRKKNWNTSVLEQVTKAGYTYVYTAETGFVEWNNGHIARVCLEKNQSLLSIKRWMEGGYDVFSLF